ncbi:hypothetical protein C8F04DRAFT_1188898 [Mycena alexandri]|uniref:Uncharacterized protein n=1 Tax=Mycena alexandri TaxID=1745969 RepID=A0AAD6WX97_9AGAR|nr:hypothetical protein C8F04DRAFT_1188898 [Mycena alexandri]
MAQRCVEPVRIGPRDFAGACRATAVAVLACPGGRLGYLSTVPNHSKVALKINVSTDTTSQVIAVHQRSTCQSQFKYPQVVSVGMKQRKESATASIGDILLPREKNSHLHARRDTVVHVDATAVHGTVHRGVRHLSVSARLTAQVFVILQGFLRHMVHHGVQYFAAPAATAAPAPGLCRAFPFCIFFLPPSSRWRPTSIPGSITGYMQSSSSQSYPAHSAGV